MIWPQLSFLVSLFTTPICPSQNPFSFPEILKVTLDTGGNTTPEYLFGGNGDLIDGVIM